MTDNDDVQAVFEQAEELLQLCRSLNYRAIVAHDPAAVGALREAVRILRQSIRSEESLADYTATRPRRTARSSTPNTIRAKPGAARDKLLERRRRCVEALSLAGLGIRLGKIYCTTDERRQVAFRETPHKTGLPQFDMVVGPDFSPVNGYHGIFIGEQEVMSCVLPLPGESHQWQVRERERFADIAQMVDLVGLLSAGFPLN
jgi:hypothetical protein